MKLNRLTLKNFKGIKSFTLDTQGGNADIYGDNATGKTSIFDAFTWLLFDKDSLNRKDFEIKTLTPEGTPIHGLDHEVEAVLSLDDGTELTLRKVYAEKWVKRRGSAQKQFTGHTIDHFVNGVPVKKSEYEARIAEIIDEDTFKLLTNPKYFNEHLHWQKRREILLQVCGDVSDAEVIASNKDLARLPEILGNRTLDEHRKVIQARRSEINKELDRIPVRIDEVQQGLPDISTITNEEALSYDIAKLRDELKVKQEELAQARAGGQVAEKTKQLRMIEAELIEIEKQCRAKYEAEMQEKRKALNIVQEEYHGLLASLSGMEKSLELLHEELASLGNKLTTLRARWHEENEKQFEFEQSDTCPTCGQKLPEEKLQEAREKALARFNQEKAERLEAINSEGKQLKPRADEIKAEIEQLRQKVAEARKQLQSAEVKIEALKNEISELEKQQVFATANESKFNAKHFEKLNLEKEIEQLREGNVDEAEKIQKEIDTISAAIQALEQASARLEAHKNGLKRIEELKAQERKLAAEYERLEQELYLTDEFIRTKVHLLEEKINSKFKVAKFKLFNVLINGGIEETCETLYRGVPYSSLNNGARINIGLDIISTLSEHYGFSAPIFIDNREAITRLVPIQAQVISLIVSEQDKKLRVERVEQKEKIKEAV